MAQQILIASTTWWAMPARMALAFSRAGAAVSGVFPRGNPLGKVRSLRAKAHYSAAYPLCSLRKVMAAGQFDLIVPCDDRVIVHLHQLYAESSKGLRRNEKLCALIERSLGDPSHYSTTLNRGKALRLAGQNEISVPQTSSIKCLDELRTWSQQYGFPSVLKVDGTWGGSGVRVIHTWEEAEAAFYELTKPLSIGSIIRHASFHDFYPLFTHNNRNRELTVQTYIEGSLANAMFACWEGEVVGALDVEVLYSREKLGASTIVRTSSNQQMEEAGRIIAKAFSLSGFFGLDFMIESTTGTPYLLELNPRATQLGHLAPPGHRSLADILHSRLIDAPQLEPVPTGEQTIAFFPQSLRCDSDNPILARSDIHHDVPWDEPALVKELKRRPWNDRQLSALAYLAAGKFLRKFAGGPLADSPFRRNKRFELNTQRSKN